jgi:hypothetical protein
MIEGPERCTRPPALTVGRNVKCLSNPRKGAPSTAKNATGSTDRLEEIDTRPGISAKTERGSRSNSQVHPCPVISQRAKRPKGQTAKQQLDHDSRKGVGRALLLS